MLRLLFIAIFVVQNIAPVYAKPPVFTKEFAVAEKVSKDLNIPVFIIVSADWCLYCNQLDEQISDNLKLFDDIIILKIDFDKNAEFVKENKIKKLPTIIYQNKQYIGKQDIHELKKILGR
jgi:thiol-disulfide isomerase/thioredoxin